jgi:hypothetical protein
VYMLLRAQLKTFFADIRKLVTRSSVCTEKLWDCIKKWQYTCSCVLL